MEQRISLITLAVGDVARSRAFYVDGLGWQPTMEAPGVLMIRTGEHLLLSLWDRAEFAEEVGAPADGPGIAPITLAHNVATPELVAEVLDTARQAGADPVSEAEERSWGGVTGYFADPDGFRWEVAWAPGQVNEIVVPQA